MLIEQKEAKIKKNTASCMVWEYGFLHNNLGLALAKINGRYPEQGKVVNEQCDVTYFVKSGKGKICCGAGVFEIKEGDAVFFEKNKWYWVEGQNLFVVVSSSPAWMANQYKEID